MSSRTPNDQKSNVRNPTSSDYKAMNDNRSNQMNQKDQAYYKSRGK